MGNLLASVAHDDERFSHPLQTSAAIILGGETTVQVRGNGIGGRNQETAMSAIERIAGLKGVAIAAIGTDGIDGNSPAAGAIIDGNSASRADQLGLNLREFMERNDSYNLFHALHDNIVTGRTGTNVGDLYILVRSK
jgi:glycerate-2-kinase